MKVVWTSVAIEKLDEIERFIAQDNPKRASEFIDTLLEKGDSMGLYPDSGRVVLEISYPEIREVFVCNYRIVYHRTPVRIEILTVFEGHRSIRIDELEH
ncbi:MAG: type II toxin-antitoxin system RelE/ParE family toxin [Chlorobiaceae bacterium]|jgi:toxin ParE1/3/4|nr:type II toxin-antitoxin system RelE/ParE family toxin [Chlorobiaceae bacterium]